MLSHLTITPLSHSGCDRRYVISNGTHHFEANELMTELITHIKEAGDIDRGIAKFKATHDTSISNDELKRYITTKLIDKLNNKQPARQFLYQREIISAEMLTRVSSAARFLFKPWIMSTIILCGVVAETLFFIKTSNLLRYGLSMEWWVMLCTLAFIVASSAFHELGHATACRYYGIGHGGIGFGLHFSFPVFYTDVSQAWTLTRSKRCVINIAGIYFQLILIVILTTLYFMTHSDMVRFMVVAINMSFILTMNPFFKFDGYWMAADLMGITNLRTKTHDVLHYLWQRIRRKPDIVKPDILRLPQLIRYTALTYTLCINLFFIYFFLYLIPTFFVGLWGQVPGQLRAITYFLSNRMIPPFALLMNIASEALFVALIGFMLYNFGKSLWKRIRSTESVSAH